VMYARLQPIGSRGAQLPPGICGAAWTRSRLPRLLLALSRRPVILPPNHENVFYKGI